MSDWFPNLFNMFNLNNHNHLADDLSCWHTIATQTNSHHDRYHSCDSGRVAYLWSVERFGDDDKTIERSGTISYS
jgi:hypothetical protein